jgi:deoxyribose-phosphate aldolase
VLSGKGADVSDIEFVKKVLGNNMKIKIDGGVKTLKRAKEIVEAGADRIGVSSTFDIAREVLPTIV